LFLFAAIVFGAWWAISVREYRDWPFVQYAVAVIIGVMGGAMVWQLGAGFESNRLLAVVVAFLVPPTIVSLVRST
jgi:hypothetical protein